MRGVAVTASSIAGPGRDVGETASVGDLLLHTTIQPFGGGRFPAVIRRGSEIWGPMGGSGGGQLLGRRLAARP